MNERQPLAEVVIDNINRELGEDRGTNARLAKFLGIHPSIVSKWRAGRHLPHIETLERIAEFLRLPLTELFKETAGKEEGVLNGLDLFSGIGGLTLALEPWVRPVAYCEIDRYCQAVLLSRMASGGLPTAPIWDDVTSLSGAVLPRIDIICGGFPCQDLSVAGLGKGLAGERSGLFFEIERLTSEIRPRFLFLENVPAIRSRGADVVAGRLARLGYDCRWGVLSAFDVGAPHLRERWWLLAHGHGHGLEIESQRDRQGKKERWALRSDAHGLCHLVPDPECSKLRDEQGRRGGESRTRTPIAEYAGWWESEPNVGRVVDGCPFRVDRLRTLGNGVVPATAREAFKRLMGL